MKLTQADYWILPDWMGATKESKRLAEWLFSEENEPLESETAYIIKVKQSAFLFVYVGEKEGHSNFPKLDGHFRYNGFFNLTDYKFYDLGYDLKHWMKLGDAAVFQTREMVMGEAEEKISVQIRKLMNEEWESVLISYKGDTKDLRPVIDKSEIRSLAEKSYLEGKKTAEIVFNPQFSFGSIQRFRITYLHYLTDKEQVSEAIARQWLKQNLVYVSQRKILAGCVREELLEIYQNPGDRIHKISRLKGAVEVLNCKTVVVHMRKNGQAFQIRMKAEGLANPKGRYPFSCVMAKDRSRLQNWFGKYGEIDINEIEQVLYQKSLLYHSKSKEECMEETAV